MVLDELKDELHRKLLARVPSVELIGVIRHQEQPLIVSEIEHHLHRRREPAQDRRDRFFGNVGKYESFLGIHQFKDRCSLTSL